MPGSQPTDASIWIFSFIFQCKPQLAIHWLKRNMKYIFKRNKSFVNEQKFAIFILINGFWTQTSILHFLYSFDLVSFRFRFGSFSFSLLWWSFFFLLIFFSSHFFFSFTIRRLFFFVVASEVQPILFALLCQEHLKKTVRFRFCEFLLIFFIKWKR